MKFFTSKSLVLFILVILLVIVEISILASRQISMFADIRAYHSMSNK